MPLHGKIVVIKRSGGDGPELPLKASCLFGRKPDSDIRIQLPQVSKEHCRIDLNENKEVILTNLSSVNPTLVNGEPLQQAERLKHGDVITIIDRCFRFECPPPSTPKRSSLGRKSDTLKVQQLGDSINVGPERKNSDEDLPKDGHDVSHCLDETVAESKQEDNSPFSDLYQMIKKSLDIKTPAKSSDSRFQTPSSKFCTPKQVSAIKSAVKCTPKDASGEAGAQKAATGGTPKSAQKQRRSSLNVTPNKAEAEPTPSQPKRAATPQKFTASQILQQVVQTPKSPKVKSRETTPAKSTTKNEEMQASLTPQSEKVQRRSPRDHESGKVLSQKRKSGDLVNELPVPQMKRKRVSFGGHLTPELFDKKLPPDSPLRRGATPRRSLCLAKPKGTLLRRASIIGLLKETDQEHSEAKSPASAKTKSPAKSPKSRVSSPKASTPEKKIQKPKTPSPKSKSTSPKAATPVQKSPKPRTPSPKAKTPVKMTPKAQGASSVKSKKADTPAKESASSSPASENAAFVKSKPNKEAKISRRLSSPGPLPKTAPTADKRRASLAVSSLAVPPALTPNIKAQTPSVQGRFSVSRISTPSPVTEGTTTYSATSAQATPKIPLKKKSMKTQKSAAKLIRRSGVSRASMKAMSFADMVKFGKAKMQVATLAQKSVNKKTTKTVKKTVPKPQTPARKLMDYTSTGHAASPATIVVGRALKQKVVQPTGAPPTIVFNAAILKKNMKMDEDLSGVSEMFKTPMNKKSRASVVDQRNVSKTPVVEQSILNTPEETGEMVVSPLTVASVSRGKAYNSEAVKRLLNGHQDESIPPLQMDAEESGEQTEECVSLVSTPNQKPAVSDCLTGVKRIMKTPKQKSEPIEDLRGKILKTPKVKLPQQECLTGVKRIMKTPKQKAEPVEDLRGNLLITPKQKAEQKECLTGVKRIMTTPKERSQPVEEHLGIKRLMTSPRLPGNPPVEDFEGLQELMEEAEDHTAELAEPATVEDEMQLESEPQANVDEPAHTTSPVIESSVPAEAEPTEISPNVADPVTDNVPSNEDEERVDAIVEHVTMEQTVSDLHSAGEKPAEDKLEDEAAPAAEMEVDPSPVLQKKSTRGRRAKAAEPKEVDVVEEPVVMPVRARRGRKAEAMAQPTPKKATRGRKAKLTEAPEVAPESVPDAGVEVSEEALVREASEETLPQPEREVEPEPVQAKSVAAPVKSRSKRGRKQVTEPSKEEEPEASIEDTTQTEVLKAAAATVVTSEQLEEKLDQESSESVKANEEHVMESDTVEVPEPEVAVVQKKTVRGRKAKVIESQTTEEADEPISAPVRGRRGKKVEATVAVVKPTRGRNAKSTAVDVDAEATQEQVKVVQKPKRGTKKVAPEVVPVESVVPVPEEATETSEEPAKEAVQEENELIPDVMVEEPKVTVAKPRRGRKPKAEAAQAEVAAEEIVVPTEIKEKSQPPVRARRGRNAKQAEENPENEAAEPQEPVQKGIRGRKQAPVESQAPSGEAVESDKINTEDVLIVNPKRGSKTKEIVTAPEPDENLAEVLADKPKRGRAAKPSTEVAEEVQEVTSEPEEKKPRGRRVKSALKDEGAETVPAKRARRGAAVKPVEETESAEVDQEPLQEPAPVVRGRRGLKKPEDSDVATVQDLEPKVSKRSVKWREDLEVHEIPKATPKRAVRGRKSKLEEQNDSDVKTTEEEDLSEKVVEPQPAKRGRRGAKAAEESTSKVPEAAPADEQPKTRRGRSAKK